MVRGVLCHLPVLLHAAKYVAVFGGGNVQLGSWLPLFFLLPSLGCTLRGQGC